MWPSRMSFWLTWSCQDVSCAQATRLVELLDKAKELKKCIIISWAPPMSVWLMWQCQHAS